MGELEHKYEVEIQVTEKRQKLPQEVKDELKVSGMMDEKGKLKLKGVSPKMLKKMKLEFVGINPTYAQHILACKPIKFSLKNLKLAYVSVLACTGLSYCQFIELFNVLDE